MTTTVKIQNHGPGRIRIRLRDVALSARMVDRDAAEYVIEPGENYADHLAVWDTRKLIIEEVPHEPSR